MFVHLWTKGPCPPEYIELVLCERFGWTLAELRATAAADIHSFITMIETEAKVRNRRAG